MSEQPPGEYPGHFPQQPWTGQQPGQGQQPWAGQPWQGQQAQPWSHQSWPGQQQPGTGEQARYQIRPDQEAHGHGQADAAGLAVPQAYTPPPPVQGYGQPLMYNQIQPLNAGIAVVASLFIPGLGSMLSHKAGKGVLILCCYIVAWILCAVLVGFILAPGVWIWGMIAAYNDANQ